MPCALEINEVFSFSLKYGLVVISLWQVWFAVVIKASIKAPVKAL